MMDWISTKDRLPEPDVDVLMWFKRSKTAAVGSILNLEDEGRWTCNISDGFYTDCDVEPFYWMPLPEPPKSND